ncbi:MAG: glycoside hydrolase family 31 protein, partial [Clostridia bacterium]|nr:glycoside hydrolase family 31 protein [Clostridia bacterium]
IKEQTDIVHNDGIPIMRPLFLDFCNDEKVWDIDTEYMFGNDVLVAPVLQQGATDREVYLPCGADWEDTDGNTYHGGTTVTAKAPIDTIPVFFKNGRRVF